jgi:hypothetical protein
MKPWNCLVLAVALGGNSAVCRGEERRPNVVLFLADDKN